MYFLKKYIQGKVSIEKEMQIFTKVVYAEAHNMKIIFARVQVQENIIS